MQDRPLYQIIEATLAERIQQGAYPVGSLMPTEAALAAEFETSRFTVREALRKLVEAGFVSRRQGRGTEVVSATPGAGFVLSFGSMQELFQVAVETWFVLHDITEVTLDAGLAERVGGQSGESWFRVTGVRWTAPGGRAICVIESYIPGRFSDTVAKLEDHDGPFFSLIEEAADGPIDEVIQEIRAIEMPRDVSQKLGLPRGSWALQLLRRYCTGSDVVIASFNWHPADQLTYKMRIERHRG